MQFPSRKPAHLVEVVSGLERKQELPQLVRSRRLHYLGASLFMELLEPFVAKAGKLHRVPLISVCTVLPYTSRPVSTVPKMTVEKIPLPAERRPRSHDCDRKQTPNRPPLTVPSRS